MFDDALLGVRNYLARPEHWVVGLMTGTSVDAVDAVLVRFTGVGMSSTHGVIAYRESALDAQLRREVLELATAKNFEPERLLRVDAALGECYAAAVLELLAHAGVSPDRIDAVGSHGQTVRHVPRDRGEGHAFTLQIGSAAVLAERTGIAVVSDFRSRDVAAGGEGAPLVPLVDWWLFRSAKDSRVMLNLGGMANVTHLPRGGSLDRVLAFDTGPGNVILDALAAELTNGAQLRDEGGALALSGKADEGLLGKLLDEPFFALPPPRSTGRERFGTEYASRLLAETRSRGGSGADAMATATELTAASVAGAIERFLEPRGGADVVVASGGGVHNPALMRALARRLKGVPVVDSSTLGVDPAGKEALAFAFLAHQTMCGLAGNVPSATGADRTVVLGHITPGAAS
jgi:anhydro-N-acetylmuramic acid kinase